MAAKMGSNDAKEGTKAVVAKGATTPRLKGMDRPAGDKPQLGYRIYEYVLGGVILFSLGALATHLTNQTVHQDQATKDNNVRVIVHDVLDKKLARVYDKLDNIERIVMERK